MRAGAGTQAWDLRKEVWEWWEDRHLQRQDETDAFWDLDVSGCASPFEKSPSWMNTPKCRICLENTTSKKLHWCKFTRLGGALLNRPVLRHQFGLQTFKNPGCGRIFSAFVLIFQLTYISLARWVFVNCLKSLLAEVRYKWTCINYNALIMLLFICLSTRFSNFGLVPVHLSVT